MSDIRRDRRCERNTQDSRRGRSWGRDLIGAGMLTGGSRLLGIDWVAPIRPALLSDRSLPGSYLLAPNYEYQLRIQRRRDARGLE